MSMYFSDYGRLVFLSRSDYLSGEWEYVCSSVSYDDDREYDIVRNYDGSDWRYTSIQNNPERDFFFNDNYTQAKMSIAKHLSIKILNFICQIYTQIAITDY